MMENTQKPPKKAGENEKFRWRRPCLAKKGQSQKKISSIPPQETERRGRKPDPIPNTKDACIVEAHESTRQRLDSSLPADHEDHIAGKVLLR